MLSHDVYFTLHESTPAARAKLVAACKKYLTGHPGEVFFAAGTLCEDLRRPVNDVAFDVALHVVFKTMAEHNLGALLDAGLVATVNSDDPAYFGGYVNANFVAAFDALPQLGARQAWQLARNSFDASFADDARKSRWRAALDATFSEAAGVSS